MWLIVFGSFFFFWQSIWSTFWYERRVSHI